MKEERRKERREKQAEFVRQQLIESAWEIINSDGIAAATMDEVAKRAGYATGSIYNYFSNKDELLVRAVQWYMGVSRSRLLEPLPAGLDAYGQLKTMVHRILQDAHSNRGSYLALYQYFPFLNESLHREVQEWMDNHVIALVRELAVPLEALVASLGKPRIKGYELGYVLFGMIHGDVARVFFGETTAEHLEEHADQVVRVFLYGVCGVPGLARDGGDA